MLIQKWFIVPVVCAAVALASMSDVSAAGKKHHAPAAHKPAVVAKAPAKKPGPVVASNTAHKAPAAAHAPVSKAAHPAAKAPAAMSKVAPSKKSAHHSSKRHHRTGSKHSK